MPQHQIIIDCDPGQDDAVALLLALASPGEIEILAVTTVAGNVPLARTTRNAQQVLALAGRSDIPVYAGCPRPILRPLETAEYVHGETGLNGAVLPGARAQLWPTVTLSTSSSPRSCGGLRARSPCARLAR